MIYANSLDLTEAINAVIKFAASKYLPILCCVNFNNVVDDLAVMATSGNCLSIFRIMDQELENAPTFSKSIAIVDAKMLLKALKGLNTKVEISFDSKLIKFNFDGKDCSFDFLEASFPRLDRLYPSTFRTKFKFDRVHFLGVLKSLKSGINKNLKMKRVHLEVTKGAVNLSAPDAEAESCISYFSITNGERQSVTLNIDDLIDILSAVKFDTLDLGMNDKESPIVISCPQGIFTAVSMPFDDIYQIN